MATCPSDRKQFDSDVLNQINYPLMSLAKNLDSFLSSQSSSTARINNVSPISTEVKNSLVPIIKSNLTSISVNKKQPVISVKPTMREQEMHHTIALKLKKPNGESYGFELGRNMVIDDVETKSIAQKCGLRDKDLILMIDREYILKMTYAQVAEMFKRTSLDLLICRFSTNFDDSQNLIKYVVIDADLKAKEIGITVGMNYVIEEVRRGSPASKSELKPGQRIISINDEDASQMDRDEFTECLKKNFEKGLLLGIFDPNSTKKQLKQSNEKKEGSNLKQRQINIVQVKNQKQPVKPSAPPSYDSDNSEMDF